MYPNLANMQPNDDESPVKTHTIFLRSETIIGCNQTERTNRQAIAMVIDVTFTKNSKSLSTVLSAIQVAVQEHLANTEPQLLEKLAYDTASLVLDSAHMVHATRVTVRKPSALLHAQCAYAVVYMTRSSCQRS